MEEAKEIFDSGKIEGDNTFIEASWPCRMIYVDCSSIIGKRHSYTVLLFPDAIHPSARPGQHKSLSRIKPMFSLILVASYRLNSDPSASS